MKKVLNKHFYFVRHAETDWNSRKLCQGHKDIPLNEKGIKEAKNLAERSCHYDFDCIVTSPLSRALETAKEIHQVHPKAEFYTIPEIAERFWGELEGVSSEEMYAIEMLEEDDPGYYPGRGVESRGAFRQRILHAIALAQASHLSPLIVSHGRVFTELCYVLSIPLVRQIPKCQVIKISSGSSGWETQILC